MNNRKRSADYMDNSDTSDVVFEYTGDIRSVPKDVISVIFNEGVQKINHGAFINCKSLESITLPSTVTEIDNGAFYNCSNLRGVTFNEGLQKIEERAFWNCTSLKNIKFPSSN